MIARVLAATIAAVSFSLSFAAVAEEVPFSDPRWEFVGAKNEFVSIGGREAWSVFNCLATLKGAGFVNGVISFDVMVTPERGFHGVYFRTSADGFGENFYIRSHQNGKEDANQYSPLFTKLTAWQLYYGPQFSAPTPYRFNEWITIKVAVNGDRATFYVDGEPVLHVADLKGESVSGDIALSSGFAPAYFSNFRFEKDDQVETPGEAAPMPTPAPGTVLEWEVSSPFDEATLEGVTALGPEHTADLSWRRLQVEDKGYANLSRVSPFGQGSNTVFARLGLTAERERVETLRFGYSDRVKVFVNGELLYAGDNGYQTRDYRYLGTIGLFDAVALRLRPGENEVLFAVSESFGGWGVMAKLDDAEGLTTPPLAK